MGRERTEMNGRMNMKKIKSVVCLLTAIGCSAFAGCNDADVASQNLSKAADNFQINRRVVFHNGITGEYMLSIEGMCSLGNSDKSREVSIVCKTGPNSFKK